MINKPYIQYEKSDLINNWAELIKLSKEEVENLYSKWEETTKINDKLAREKFSNYNKIVKDIDEFLTIKGIKISTVKKFKSVYEKWFIDKICSQIESNRWNRPSMPVAHGRVVEINGVKVSNNKSPTFLNELYRNIKSQYERGLEVLKATDEALKNSIAKAIELKVDITNLQSNEIFDKVNNILKEKYEKENLVNGKELPIDDNYCECESYIIGDSRCSCGNRRISCWVEGNYISGFYIQTEPS